MLDNRRIIFTRPDGGVSIVVPAVGATDDQLMSCVPPDSIGVEIVTANDIPSDRTFRDAWVAVGRSCEVDVEKAKVICHEKRRAARAAEFAPLDVEATIPAKATEAESKRQVIRDKYAAMQTAIDAAIDVATLKSISDQIP